MCQGQIVPQKLRPDCVGKEGERLGLNVAMEGAVLRRSVGRRSATAAYVGRRWHGNTGEPAWKPDPREPSGGLGFRCSMASRAGTSPFCDDSEKWDFRLSFVTRRRQCHDAALRWSRLQ